MTKRTLEEWLLDEAMEPMNRIIDQIVKNNGLLTDTIFDKEFSDYDEYGKDGKQYVKFKYNSGPFTGIMAWDNDTPLVFLMKDGNQAWIALAHMMCNAGWIKHNMDENENVWYTIDKGLPNDGRISASAS